MISLRLRKILRDLWSTKSRTLLAVLSIAVGVFALSLTLRTQAMLSHTMLTSYAAVNPADATLTLKPFDELLVDALRQRSDLRAVDGRSRIDVRILVGEQWRRMSLTVVPDFETMQINRLAPAGGAWPPPIRTLLVERSWLDATGVRIGDSVVIETSDRHQSQLLVVGLTHDVNTGSGRLGSPYIRGYVSLDTAKGLGLTGNMNTLHLVVAGNRFDAAHVRTVVHAVRTWLDRNETRVLATRMYEPGKPMQYDIVTSLLDTLRMLGVLSLVLSTLLVTNTIAGLLSRQVPQIGVLKAIGAARRTIILMYLRGVLILGVLALLVALPPAIFGARALTAQLAYLINYDIQSFGVPLYVRAVEVSAALIAPLLAGLSPILAGTRLTVRQAIASPSNDLFGRGAFDRMLGLIRGIPMTHIYALRNMARRKGRLALTIAVLALGGAITIAVFSARASLFATLEQAAGYWQQDITITFDRQHGVDTTVHQAQRIPGVVGVEDQPAHLAVRQRPSGDDAEQLTVMYGVRPYSQLLRPTVLRGRWVAPDKKNEVVVNVNFLKHEPDVDVGDSITLLVGERETDWKVVGVVTAQLFLYGESTLDQGVVYANETALKEAISQHKTTNRVLIVTARHDPAFQAQVARALAAHFGHRGVQIGTETRADLRVQVFAIISALVLLLLVMVCMFIVVAGLSLMGAMSLNVLDRTKEIGVLRAIGASNSKVTWIILTEGIYTGMLSWALATLLAMPLSKLISDMIGWNLVNWPLVYRFPPIAVLLWLVIAIVLAAAASFLPATSAARLSVRDVLAYE